MGLHVSDINVLEEFPIMLHVSPVPSSCEVATPQRDISNTTVVLQAWWWSLVCYTLTLAFSKVSICLLYLSIFTLEWARRACHVVLAIVVLSNVWAFVSVLTFTVPLAATWDYRVVAAYTTKQEIWWAITGYADCSMLSSR